MLKKTEKEAQILTIHKNFMKTHIVHQNEIAVTKRYQDSLFFELHGIKWDDKWDDNFSDDNKLKVNEKNNKN